MRLNANILEVAQAVNPVARQFDFVTVIPGRLKLPKLTANDHITGSAVAGDVDFSDIGTAGGVCLQDQRYPVIGPVNFRTRINPGKSKAKIAKIVDKSLGGFGHFVGVVGLTRADRDQ